MDISAIDSGVGGTDTPVAKTDTIITTPTTETEGITITTTMADTAAVATTTATIAAVGDRPEEVRAVKNQTVAGMGKASRSRRDVTAGPTRMDPTRVWLATIVRINIRKKPPLQTCKVVLRRDTLDTKGVMA